MLRLHHTWRIRLRVNGLKSEIQLLRSFLEWWGFQCFIRCRLLCWKLIGRYGSSMVLLEKGWFQFGLFYLWFSAKVLNFELNFVFGQWQTIALIWFSSLLLDHRRSINKSLAGFHISIWTIHQIFAYVINRGDSRFRHVSSVLAHIAYPWIIQGHRAAVLGCGLGAAVCFFCVFWAVRKLIFMNIITQQRRSAVGIINSIVVRAEAYGLMWSYGIEVAHCLSMWTSDTFGKGRNQFGLPGYFMSFAAQRIPILTKIW